MSKSRLFAIQLVFVTISTFVLSGCGLISGELKQLFSSGPEKRTGIFVHATNPNGAYRAGQTITIEVLFPSEVVVTGSPALKLATGRSGAEAAYVSGSGTETLIFDYTVQTGDRALELDYLNALAISETAGTIRSSSNEILSLTLSAPGSLGSIARANDIVLDTDLPTSISSLDDGFGVVSTSSTPITTWVHATDTTTSIVYQIAIGTTPGGTDALNWTSQTGLNSATVTGLTLVAGTTYYTSVRAIDEAGNVGAEVTGDGWRAVDPLVITPAPKMLVVNERYPFTVAGGYPGYTFTKFSGVGNLVGNLFTAPSTAGSAVLRATDQMNVTANTNITVRQFGLMSSLQPKMVNPEMTIGGMQYDSLGNLYVAGMITDYSKRWLVRKYDGTTWTTLLDENSGQFGEVTGILVNSPTDIWAIGSKYTTYYVWTVKHFDGTTWTTSDSFSLAAYSSYANGIAKGPGGEIYVVGSASLSFSSTRWIVRKYAAGSWTTFNTYQRNGTSNLNTAYAVAVNSLGDIFVGGSAYQGATNADWIVRRYSGGSWTDSDVVVQSLNDTAKAIVIDSSDNVYVAGDLTSPLTQIRKYSGGTWTSLGGYTDPLNSREEVTALGLDSSGRPYVTMRTYDGTSYNGYVVRYSGTGTTWERVSSIPKFDVSALTKNAAGEMVFAGALDPLGYWQNDGEEWNVYKTDGTTTSEVVKYQAQTIAPGTFTDIAFDSHGIAYVTGFYKRLPNSSGTNWFVKKFDGTTWTDVDDYNPSPMSASSEAHGIYIDENDHVWVTGYAVVNGEYSPVVRKFDGTSWTTVDYSKTPGAPSGYGYGIAGKAGKIYVVGTENDVSFGWVNALVKRFDGTSWSVVLSDPGHQQFVNMFTDVLVDSNGVIWASLYRWDSSFTQEVVIMKSADGTTWTTAATWSDPENIERLQLLEGAPGQIYVTFTANIPNGDKVGTIMKWDGTTWSTFDQTANGSGYNNGARDTEGNLYFVGYEGTKLMIKKWNGYYLDKVHVPVVQAANTNELLNSVAAGPSGKLIGVGKSKVTTRFTEPVATQLEP